MKMDDVGIDDVQMKVLSLPDRDRSGVKRQDSVEHAGFQLSCEECTHCLMFSASTSATATLVAINLGNRLLETDAPLVSSEIVLTSSFSITIDPLEHGPPGNLVPRHILIGVFRI